MSAFRERSIIRALHLILSVPIIGFIYGPVAHIAPAAQLTRFVAVPVVLLSGLWMWQKPRLMRWARHLGHSAKRNGRTGIRVS
jgi:hypothetical protein